MVTPHGIPIFPFIIWWFFHYLRVFKNRDYEIFIVFCGKRLVHYSVAMPPSFRFPFMSKNDIQICNVWTHPKYRRKGIATFACERIISSKIRQDRKFWYIAKDDNTASVKTAEKIGFYKSSTGKWIIMSKVIFKRVNSDAI